MGFTTFLTKYTTRRPSPTIPPSPPAPSSWTSAWPSCERPTIESFRERGQTPSGSSPKCCDHDRQATGECPYSPWSTSSGDDLCSSDGFSTTASEQESTVEAVVHRATAPGSRLLYDPVGRTSSILEESKAGEGFPFKESAVLVVDASDPYAEFRAAIREMAVAHGLDDFRYLRELLEWYLRVNDEKMHDFILEAFVDLLLELSSPSSSLRT